MAADSDEIELTTENDYGRAALRRSRCRIVLSHLFGVLVIVPVFFMPSEGPFVTNVLPMATLLVIFAVAGIIAQVNEIARGTWLVGADGLSFVSRRIGTTTMRWEQITQVKWKATEAGFRHESSELRFDWADFEPSKAESAKRIIEHYLSGQFDLAPPPPLIGPGVWSKIRWAGKMILVSIPLTALCFSGILAATYWAPESELAWGLGLLLLFLPMFAMVWGFWRESRRNPDWRCRRDESPLMADHVESKRLT